MRTVFDPRVLLYLWNGSVVPILVVYRNWIVCAGAIYSRPMTISSGTLPIPARGEISHWKGSGFLSQQQFS